MFPLKSNKIVGYKFGSPTFYGTKHLGTDYGNYGDNIYAPFDGEVTLQSLPELGNCIFFKPDNADVVMRFGHCKEFKVKNGEVKEGQIMGVVGYTGLVSPPGINGSHLHLDISKHQVNIFDFNNFLNPETYDWQGLPEIGEIVTTYPIKLKMAVVMNNSNWTPFLSDIKQWIGQRGELELEIDIIRTTFAGIPSKVLPTGQEFVDEQWFDRQVMPKAQGYDLVLLVLNHDDWDKRPWGGFYTLGYEYFPKYPCKMFICCEENDKSIHYTNFKAFYDYARHEIGHALYSLGKAGGFDFTHNRYFGQNGYPRNFDLIFEDLDYELLNINLTKGRQMSNVLVVKKGDEYGFYVPATTEDSLIDKALNYGVDLPTKDNGTKVDWAKLKPNIIIS